MSEPKPDYVAIALAVLEEAQRSGKVHDLVDLIARGVKAGRDREVAIQMGTAKPARLARQGE